MKGKVWPVVSLVLSLVLSVGVMTLFHACPRKEDGSWMHCHSVQNTICCIGIALAAVSILLILISSRAAGIILSLAAVAACIISALLPGGLMKMCMMNTMRCYTVMKPFVLLMSIAIALVNLLNLYATVKKAG